MPLINLYEMARSRGEAMWAVLDWAAQQPGDFTYQDLYRVFTANGGHSTIQQFHSMVKVAKPWSDDPSKQEVSEKRPFVFSKRGSRGKGGAASLSWGLDGPLRPPQQAKEPMGEPGTPVGDILDKLEKKMGRPALQAAMKRWRGMTDLHRIAADIRATVPGRYQMDALQVATDHLVQSGQADAQDVEDAEDEVQASPEEPATPFNPPKPKPKAAVKPAAHAHPHAQTASSDDDDEDLGPGWRTIPNEPEPGDEPDEEQPGEKGDEELEDLPDDMFSGDVDVGSEEEPEASDDEGEGGQEFPVYLPEPDEDGDRYENAMYRLVHEVGLGADDPLWDQLKSAKNDVEARKVLTKSRIPTQLQRLGMLVAKAIFDNTGRDFETGKKIGESRLMRLYELGTLDVPVDFDQESGLDRIKKGK